MIKDVNVPNDEADTATQPDRRRFGRRDKVSNNLIPLLRSVAKPDALEADLAAFKNSVSIIHDDDLNVARGMANGVSISVVLWCLLSLVGYFIFR